jgi:putative phosphoesterase
MMRTIGAISDTHGLLRPQALAALAGWDPIIHAGDVGSPDVLARLGALAPVHAVRGNVDHGAWSAKLPVTQRIEIDFSVDHGQKRELALTQGESGDCLRLLESLGAR